MRVKFTISSLRIRFEIGQIKRLSKVCGTKPTWTTYNISRNQLAGLGLGWFCVMACSFCTGFSRRFENNKITISIYDDGCLRWVKPTSVPNQHLIYPLSEELRSLLAHAVSRRQVELAMRTFLLPTFTLDDSAGIHDNNRVPKCRCLRSVSRVQTIPIIIQSRFHHRRP